MDSARARFVHSVRLCIRVGAWTVLAELFLHLLTPIEVAGWTQIPYVLPYLIVFPIAVKEFASLNYSFRTIVIGAQIVTSVVAAEVIESSLLVGRIAGETGLSYWTIIESERYAWAALWMGPLLVAVAAVVSKIFIKFRKRDVDVSPSGLARFIR